MTLYRQFVIFLLVLFVAVSFSFPDEKKTRDYLTTIQWYPRDAGELKTMLEGFFKNAELKSVPGKIVGLVGPHAGLSYSGQCAARGYKQLEGLPDLERVILLGLSHRGGFRGAAVSGFHYNATPLGNIPVDTAVTAELAKEKLFRKSNRILQDEHSLETHLPFLKLMQDKLKNDRYKIVPIVFGYLDLKDYKTMASIIKKYVTPKTLVIASTDFTHYGSNYGYVPFRDNIRENLTRLDMGMIDHIKALDFEGYCAYKRDTGITMCGFTPVGVLIHMFEQDHCKATLMDYYRSGDLLRDYSVSVSYASIVISKDKKTARASVNRSPGKAPRVEGDNKKPGDMPMSLSFDEKKTLLAIARQTLVYHFEKKALALKDIEETYEITPVLREKAGVFVTLRKRDDLRGCIGSIIGVEPLWEGVHNNVLKSAFQDPRFQPLKEKELKKIDIEISVMTPLQKIEDYKQIRLGIDGVVIRKGFNQAVYLPQVATETGWDLDQFLGHLCQKAGLSGSEYREGNMEFYIFQALVFEEKEMERHE